MQERYSISCLHCGKNLIIAPSIFHQMGLHDMGGATCTGCKKTMEVHYDENTDSMNPKKIRFDA